MLGGVVFFLAREIFFPSPSRPPYPAYILTNKNQIIFEGRINFPFQDVLNLVSFDVRNWCSRLGIWPPEAFQEALDKDSAILTGVKLEAIQQLILERKIEWWRHPFPGRIVIECGRKKLPLTSIRKDASLEEIMFLGLGLGEYLKLFRPSPHQLASPAAFLKNSLGRAAQGGGLKKFLSHCHKVKVIIEYNEKN